MHLSEKINWKKHFILSAIPFVASLLIFGGFKGFMGQLSVYLAAMVNQVMLVEVVAQTTEGRKDQISTLVMLKLFVLMGGLSLGVLFMGKWVIIAIINYLISVFLLATTSKKG